MELIFMLFICLAGFLVGVYMIFSALTGKVKQPTNDWMFSGIIAAIFGGKRKWMILFVGVTWATIWLFLLIEILLDRGFS